MEKENEKPTEQTMQTLLEYQEIFQVALKSAGICVFKVDLNRQLYIFLENAQAVFGKPDKEILSEINRFRDFPPAAYQQEIAKYFSHPDDQESTVCASQTVWTGKPVSSYARMKAGNTDCVWCKVDLIPVPEGSVPDHMIGTISNIHDIKMQAVLYEADAKKDPLTGLWNRKYAESRIQSILCSSHPQDKHALLIIDLDDFKDVNDICGHQVGDRVLEATAADLKRCFRKSDVIGRWGGDEFFVLVRDIPDIHFLSGKITAFLESSASSQIAKSIGCAIYPDQADHYSQLFELADRALYMAKQKKNTFVIAPPLKPPL